MRPPPNFDAAVYNAKFRENANNIKAGPVENEYRSCKDICCVATFVLIVLFILGLGASMLSEGKQFYNQENQIGDTSSLQRIGQGLSQNAGLMVGMIIFCLVLVIVFILLVKNFPKCMVYSMIILIYLIYIALVAIGVYYKIPALWITFLIVILITTIILYCYRREIKMGIVLLAAAAQFITEKPSVYVAPLYPFFFSILFMIWWVICLFALIFSYVEKQNKEQNTSRENVFYFLWALVFVFMLEFLYYVQTFLVATCCANWYYGIQENYYTQAIIRLNRFHIGSLTFGALVVTIINALKSLAREQAEGQEGCAGICFCLIACCLSCIEDLLRVLNHNAIICMAITAESYVDSAKTAITVIFDNFGLFIAVDIISDLVTFFGTLICVGIPTIITVVATPRQFRAVTGLFVFFICIIIASVLIGMIAEAMSCVYILYCFDRKLIENGINNSYAPDPIRNLNQYEEGREVEMQNRNQPYGTDQNFNNKPQPYY